MIPREPKRNRKSDGAQQQRAPIYPTSPSSAQPNNQQKTPTKTILKIVGAVITVLVIGASAMMIPLFSKWYHNANYTKDYIVVEMMRDTKKNVRPQIDLNTVFSKENMKEMEQGKGLKVVLVTTVRGKEISRHPVVTLEPWESFEATSNPQRRQAIADKKTELTNLINNSDINQRWVIDFILDDTEGVDKVLAEKARTIFNNLELDERIKIGDGVDISFTRLSKNDYLVREQVTVPTKAKDVSGYVSQLRNGFDKLVQLREGQSESSVALGLLNALTPNSGQENREIIIISDGLENSSLTGVTFYEDPGVKQLNPSNWENLDQTFLKDVQQPELSGATVNWFAPPAAARHSKEVKLGFKYWEHFLEKLGAIEVKTNFGV